jgi:hypothetical protein
MSIAAPPENQTRERLRSGFSRFRGAEIRFRDYMDPGDAGPAASRFPRGPLPTQVTII